MQFGRLMGAGLAALGILLLFLQFSFFLDSIKAAPHPLEPPHKQHVSALPGLLGGVLLVGGVVLFFTGRIEDDADPKNAIK
jgi:nitrate reductase gamma subunit